MWSRKTKLPRSFSVCRRKPSRLAPSIRYSVLTAYLRRSRSACSTFTALAKWVRCEVLQKRAAQASRQPGRRDPVRRWPAYVRNRREGGREDREHGRAAADEALGSAAPARQGEAHPRARAAVFCGGREHAPADAALARLPCFDVARFLSSGRRGFDRPYCGDIGHPSVAACVPG